MKIYNMKPIIFTSLFLLFIIVKINAQTKMPKNVNDEFAYSVIENYKYGNGNTRLFIMQKLREKRYSPMDIDVLVESIWTNTKNRNIILEVFHNYFGKEREYLYANLKSLGISATSSKYLTDYIIEEKYKPTQIVNSDPKNTTQNTSGYSFDKRYTVTKPTPKYTCLESGKVIVEITVDREGNTIKAIAGIKGTTNTAKCLLDASKEAALNTKWNSDENAPEAQIGKIVYNFNLN